MTERWCWTADEWARIERLAMSHLLGLASARKGGPNSHQRQANIAARALRGLAERAAGVNPSHGGEQ